MRASLVLVAHLSCSSACIGGVRYVAESGSDADDGCDPSTPLATVGACVGADRTCLVFPGTYREPSPNGTLVTAASNLTIALAPVSLWPASTSATEAFIAASHIAHDAPGIEYRWSAYAPGPGATAVIPRCHCCHCCHSQPKWQCRLGPPGPHSSE